MKVLVLNGPNLGLLGKRETDIYGTETLDGIVTRIEKKGLELGIEVDAFQSDEEGALVRRIGAASENYDGVILNPAAYTHTSVALYDAIRGCGLPCVEVHLSNVHARESFRRRSLTAGACVGQISGFGGDGYLLALDGLAGFIERRRRRDVAEDRLQCDAPGGKRCD